MLLLIDTKIKKLSSTDIITGKYETGVFTNWRNSAPLSKENALLKELGEGFMEKEAGKKNEGLWRSARPVFVALFSASQSYNRQ